MPADPRTGPGRAAAFLRAPALPPVLRRRAARGRGPAAPPPDEAALARAYAASPLAARPDDFALYRILGNDLEPRHRRGQTRDNLAFVLAHEPPLAACEKRWIVNRIVDRDEEARLLDLLAAHGQPVLRLPFEPAAYARAGWDTSRLPAGLLTDARAMAALDAAARTRLRLALYRAKNAHAMHNNGARNAALADGRTRAKWILPWDGACFVTEAAWEALRAAVTAAPHLPYFVTPMARAPANDALLDPGFAPDPVEEPQILMRADAAEAFDEGFVYGRRPKVELFWRLGVPGPWDAWRDDPWDPPRPARAPEAGRVGRAGWVARLASGRAHLEREDKASFLERGVARQAAIVATLDRIDASLPNPDADARGLLCYSSAAIEALRDRLAAGATPPLAAAILAAAEAALGRGPFSVVDKTTLPPSRDRHDYWHPAPYWHPNRWIPGGLPYVQRDGERVAGTRMYEPESDAFDRTRLQRLFDDTTALALGHALTGRPDFAAHAARLVAVWFVAPETRMNPHLTYAQVRRGRNWSRGTGAGIIELKDLYYFLDAVRLVARAGALEAGVARGLDAWLGDYLGWLGASPQGRRERAAVNNHGTYYDLQTAAIAAWLGDRDALRDALIRAQSRLPGQIDADGRQPHELRRTATAHYCLFNLQGWANLVRLGRRAGLLAPDFAAEPWVRLRRAAEWTLGHDLARWPHPQLGAFDPERGAPLAAHARETGVLAAAEGPSAAGIAAAKPVFDPHDGVPPFWPLTDPDAGR